MGRNRTGKRAFPLLPKPVEHIPSLQRASIRILEFQSNNIFELTFLLSKFSLILGKGLTALHHAGRACFSPKFRGTAGAHQLVTGSNEGHQDNHLVCSPQSLSTLNHYYITHPSLIRADWFDMPILPHRRQNRLQKRAPYLGQTANGLHRPIM